MNTFRFSAAGMSEDPFDDQIDVDKNTEWWY